MLLRTDVQEVKSFFKKFKIFSKMSKKFKIFALRAAFLVNVDLSDYVYRVYNIDTYSTFNQSC